MSRQGRRNSGLARVRGTRRALRWAAGVYLALAVAGAVTVRRYEVFPFFCWLLFPLTPGQEERWELDLIEVAGHRFDDALPFFEAKPWVDTASIDAYYAIQALGAAYETAEAGERQRRRALLESAFLTLPCRYRLSRRRVDALSEFRSKIRSRPLESYFIACGDGGSPPRPVIAPKGGR